MLRTAPALVILALLSAPQVLDAQQGRRGGGGGGLLGQNPISAFLQRADSLQLDLTTDQTADLEARSEELDETTSDDRAAIAGLLQGARGGGGGGGLFREIQPYLQAIQAANNAALGSAREEVLTDEQAATVDAYLESIRPQGRGRRGGGGGPG